MPVLAEETSVYPDDLLDAPQDADAWEAETPMRRWWVLSTKSRQEKALVRELLRFEIPFYLPLAKTGRIHRGRLVCAHVPLFTGYVFLYGTEEERVRSLTTNRIARVLAVGDGDRLRSELGQIDKLIASGAPMTLESRLAGGRRVRVRRGPLAGLEGTVHKRRGRTRLLVSIDFLQQGSSVEIDDFLLEPID